MHPLIIREGLVQRRCSSDFRPCERPPCRAQHVRYLGRKITVRSARLSFWLIPTNTVTGRTDARLFIDASARDPFMVTDVTAEPHYGNWHSCHTASIRRPYGTQKILIWQS